MLPNAGNGRCIVGLHTGRFRFTVCAVIDARHAGSEQIDNKTTTKRQQHEDKTTTNLFRIVHKSSTEQKDNKTTTKRQQKIEHIIFLVLLWFCCGFVVVSFLLWSCYGFVCGFVAGLLWFCFGSVVVVFLLCFCYGIVQLARWTNG